MANYNLNLYQYNNYSDRQLKREENLDDYGEPVAQVQACNFKFGDGVNTEHVIDGLDSIPACNYAVLFTGPDNIVSRWFIIESDYISNRKFKVSLRRDVLADHWDKILNAPMMVEKATLSDSNPLIYNKENMNFNQIKTSETLLKDDTDVAWICGYVKRDENDHESEFNSDLIVDIDLGNSGISSWQYYQYTNSPAYSKQNLGDWSTSSIRYKLKTSSDYDYYKYARLQRDWGAGREWSESSWTNYSSDYSDYIMTLLSVTQNTSTYNSVRGTAINVLNTITLAEMNSLANELDITNYISETGDMTIAKIDALDGKIIKCKDSNNLDIYYKININKTDYDYIKYNIPLSYATNPSFPAAAKIKNASDAMYNGCGLSERWTSKGIGDITVRRKKRQIVLTPAVNATCTVTIPASNNRIMLKDAPYDMFCIPCPIDKQSVVVKYGTSADFTITKNFAITVGQGIAEDLGSGENGFLIDLQLLPYCPMTGYTVDNTGKITFDNANYRFTDVLNKTDSSVLMKIIWAANSNGEKSIPLSAIDVDNKKIQNQCDLYRLCSGNYSAGFDLNIAQNEGLRNITVDYTYIPYSPYIHVNPEFNNLYGRDYDDARGLVDQSDKSISYLSSQWASYVNTNKAYQQQFDRQIQNMEYNRNWAMASNIAGATSGAIGTGIASGIMTGNVGAGIGVGIGSALTGALDVVAQTAITNEAIDYAKDNFGFSLANIKASPDSVAKITAFTKNNKVFPLIEYYTCTDTEKQALANKIRYNGMTVGAIGTINEYITNSWSYNGIEDKGYIKGQIIQIPDLADDSHLVNTIITEMNKGVYTK